MADRSEGVQFYDATGQIRTSHDAACRCRKKHGKAEKHHKQTLGGLHVGIKGRAKLNKPKAQWILS